MCDSIWFIFIAKTTIIIDHPILISFLMAIYCLMYSETFSPSNRIFSGSLNTGHTIKGFFLLIRSSCELFSECAFFSCRNPIKIASESLAHSLTGNFVLFYGHAILMWRQQIIQFLWPWTIISKLINLRRVFLWFSFIFGFLCFGHFRILIEHQAILFEDYDKPKNPTSNHSDNSDCDTVNLINELNQYLFNERRNEARDMIR